MMVPSNDRINLHKYLELTRQFIDKEFSASAFETRFLDIRRNDGYLMSGSFNPLIESELGKLFIAVDSYAPIELRDEGEIDEEQLREIVTNIHDTLSKI